MISFLKGFISEVTPESAYVDVNGVGYEVFCSVNTLAEFQASLVTAGPGATVKSSKPVQVFTYTHVREDALLLFGFSTRVEKNLFTTLLKVNGIGPKMAIHILSGATVSQIHAMVEAEDVKGLSKLPKVGKKTAEQMILALKGKLVTIEDTKSAKATTASAFKGTAAQKEITSALINLGFRFQDVEKVVSEMSQDVELEAGIRQGLSALTSV